MPTIRIDTFAGEMARLHSSALPDGSATTAHNVVLTDGKLRPLRFPSVSTVPIRMENGLTAVGGARSLYLWKRGDVTELLAWPGQVHVAPSNVADDPRRRIFVTGETGVGANLLNPAVYVADLSGRGYGRSTIVKSPMRAPVVSPPVIPPEETDLRYTVFYQTWVDEYGYMSGPSEPSEEIAYADGLSVTVRSDAAPSGAVSRRIWKVISGTETESIQFVAEQAAVGATFPQFSFAASDSDAGEILPMFGSPPADLSWMSFVPGNFYAGFSPSSPRTVRFSAPGYPTTWPSDYAYDIRSDLVGLGVCGNTVVALTEGAPWLLSGASPDSISTSVMQSEYACVSARSICTMNGAVYYASSDGICVVAPSGSYPMLVGLVTEKYFGKREWAALNPSTCVMVPYDNTLHCWFTLADGSLTARTFALSEGAAAVCRHDEEAVCACYDPEDDRLYFVRGV